MAGQPTHSYFLPIGYSVKKANKEMKLIDVEASFSFGSSIEDTESSLSSLSEETDDEKVISERLEHVSPKKQVYIVISSSKNEGRAVQRQESEKANLRKN